MATSEGGVVKTLKVALGAAGPTPMHATAVEAGAEGKQATPQDIRRRR